MLCDRDAAYAIGPSGIDKHLSERLRLLPRYHLENYFLDEKIIAAIFAEMEADTDSWLRDPIQVGEKLRSLAQQTVPLAVALKVAAVARETVGNIDVMPKGVSQSTTLDALLTHLRERVVREQERITSSLDVGAIEEVAKLEYSRLMTAVTDTSSDAWKRDIPGRVILNRFAPIAKLNVGRVKTLYIRHAITATTDPFNEIRQIFHSFRGVGMRHAA
jgi:hypothetical protein